VNTNVRRTLFANDDEPTTSSMDITSSRTTTTSTSSSCVGDLSSSLSTSYDEPKSSSSTSSSYSSSYNSSSTRRRDTNKKKEDPRKERIVFCFDIGGDIAIEVLMAAHYLGIRGLHDLACRMIAANIESVETLAGSVENTIIIRLEPHANCLNGNCRTSTRVGVADIQLSSTSSIAICRKS